VGRIEDLAGHLVGLDTAPLIYYVEANPAYSLRVDPFFDALERGEMRVVTSIVTLIETSVQPIRRGDARLAVRYESLLLDTAYIDTIDVDVAIAREAARLRATHNLRTPDAIQLATAIQAGATAFITNDVRLAVVPNLNVIVPDALPSQLPPYVGPDEGQFGQHVQR